MPNALRSFLFTGLLLAPAVPASAQCPPEFAVPASSPTIPVGVAVGVASISWSWELVSDATGFYLYYSTGVVELTTSTRVEASTSPFILTGLLRDTTYNARVSGFNCAGEGIISGTGTAKTLAIGELEVPAGTTIVKTYAVGASTLNVTVPSGAFPSTVTMSIGVLAASSVGADSPVAVFGSPLLAFDLYVTEGLQPARSLTVQVCYDPASLPAGAQESDLLIAYRHAAGWLPLATSVNAAADCASASATHLSVYGLLPRQAAGSASQARAWPNPFYPGRAGYTTLNVTRAPPGATVRVYTISGEKVRQITADAQGEARWDVRNDSGESVASGVYLILVDGGGTQVLKVGVQR